MCHLRFALDVLADTSVAAERTEKRRENGTRPKESDADHSVKNSRI
jgi:hypothetical protein